MANCFVAAEADVMERLVMQYAARPGFTLHKRRSP